MQNVYIKIYVWNFDKKQFDIAKIPAFDDFNRSIKYDVMDDTIYKNKQIVELEFIEESENVEKLKKITDITKNILDGLIKPYIYVEFGQAYLEVRTIAAFGVIVQDGIYRLIYKVPKQHDKLIGPDGLYKTLVIPEIQIPYFEMDIELYIRNFIIDQSIKDVIKENPDDDVEELKHQFGDFIIEEFKKFTFNDLQNQIEKIKEELGEYNTYYHNMIYRIVENKLQLLNRRIKPYNTLSGRKTEFVFNRITRKIEFYEYEQH